MYINVEADYSFYGFSFVQFPCGCIVSTRTKSHRNKSRWIDLLCADHHNRYVDDATTINELYTNRYHELTLDSEFTKCCNEFKIRSEPSNWIWDDKRNMAVHQKTDRQVSECVII